MKSIGIGTILAATVVALAFAGNPGHDAPEASLDARLTFLKGLEGKWIAESPDGSGHEGVFEYRVTAGGTTVEERELAGTPMEMLTVYHMDGKNLVATHYCVLGNQPHFTASREIGGGALEFECDGKVSNAGSHRDQHVHSWTMRLDDDGKLYLVAAMYDDGVQVESPRFVLTRQ